MEGNCHVQNIDFFLRILGNQDNGKTLNIASKQKSIEKKKKQEQIKPHETHGLSITRRRRASELQITYNK